jgi:co-chaperonin GroES (HSP10)
VGKNVSKGGIIMPNTTEYSDIQRVVKKGPYAVEFNNAGDKISFGEGDWVKINLKRFLKTKDTKSVKDGHEFNSTQIEYYMPVVEFDGEEYFEIDQGDIEYYWLKDAVK